MNESNSAGSKKSEFVVFGFLGVIVFLFIFAFLYWYMSGSEKYPIPSQKPAKDLVSNFEECEQAGFPVMESFPRQCRDGSGNLFVEEIKKEDPVVYSNEEYGSSITLPESWKGYKTLVRDEPTGWKQIDFFLPTNDPEWKDLEPEPMTGYAPVFLLEIYSIEEWSATRSTCDKEPMPCPDEESMVLQSENFIVSVSPPQNLPTDVSEKFSDLVGTDTLPEAIKKRITL